MTRISCWQRNTWYQRKPIETVQKGLSAIGEDLPADVEIAGAATTGSARYLTSLIVGADVVKNEITAHAIASSALVEDVKTIIEIGGQDSKIIILREGVVTDFAMNTVCAAGTGSFLDQQASRLLISIEDFGNYALKAKNPVRIAGAVPYLLNLIWFINSNWDITRKI